MARLGQFLEGLIQTFVHPWAAQEAKQRLPCDGKSKYRMHSRLPCQHEYYAQVQIQPKTRISETRGVALRLDFCQGFIFAVNFTDNPIQLLHHPRPSSPAKELRIHGLRQIGSCQDDPRSFLQDASSSARLRILSRMVDRVALFLSAFFKYMPTFAFALARTNHL